MRRTVVIDTNTLLSAVLWHSAPRLAVTQAFENECVLCSKETRNELREVMRREKFDRYAPLDLRLQAAEDFIEDMLPVLVTTDINVCRDVQDNKILALAVDGHADVLITGDIDLLVLHPFHGIAILTPADYLRL